MVDTILGNVVDVASDGAGVIRYDGLVIFIPYTVVGDVIRYRIVQQKKKFAVGELVEIIDPSPLRITPRCPYFGTCGGCQLQHIDYQAQLEYKRRWVEEALRKIGGLGDMTVPSVIAAKQQWGYRRRINLVLRPRGEVFEAGYVATDNQSLVMVDQCPIFVASDDEILSIVRKLCHTLLPLGAEEGRGTILKSVDSRYIIHFHFRNMPENMNVACSEIIQSYPVVAGIVATSMRKSVQFGVFAASLEVDGLHFDFSPRAFIQNHPEQSLNIYRAVEGVGKELRPTKVLDLYCGIGITSCLLAREGASVIGVEMNREAIHLAKENAKKNHLKSTKFVVADVASVVDETLSKESPDLVLVNPPREGMESIVVEALCRHPAKTVIYISCKPSTLARDLKHLSHQAYNVQSVQPFDMFPQTVHVETMVVLKRR